MGRKWSSLQLRDRVLTVAALLVVFITAAPIGPASAAPPPRVAAQDEIGPEPAVGQPGSLDFTITVSGRSEVPISFDYRTVDGTAERGLDYRARSGTIVVPPGTFTRTVRITLIGDDVDESDETLSLVLSNPVNAELGFDPTATGTITDAGDPLVLTLSGARSYVEPDGRTNLPISIRLSLNRPAPPGVFYELTFVDGTAVAYEDYNPNTGGRLFIEGRENDSVRIVIRGDDLPEDTETFSVTVTVEGATVANSSITIRILDND